MESVSFIPLAHPICHHNFDKGSEQLDYFTMSVLCCESHPCHLILYKAMLSSEGELLVDQALAPNIARRQLYATYVRAVHGTLGVGTGWLFPHVLGISSGVSFLILATLIWVTKIVRLSDIPFSFQPCLTLN